MAGPLSGYRVLDLTSVFLGPFATQIMGDMGADVIKVEPPEGDIVRGVEPSRHPGMGAIFLNANRNKRSLVLDLKKPAGRAAFLRLVRDADVVVTSVRPAAMERLGLAYDDCRKVNARIVYCNAVGFGRGGPYSGRPAYDDVIQGLSGLAGTYVECEGSPRYVPSSIVDKIIAQVVVYAVTMALLHRERTGEGQEIEVPMFETMVAFHTLEHQVGALFDPPMGEPGYARVLAPYRRPYATADGYVSVLPYSTRQWQSFFRLVGREDMLDDPRVTDPARRSEAIAELYAIVAEAVRSWRTEDLLAALDDADVPAGRVNRLADLADDPHLHAVDFFRVFNHPSEGRIRLAGVPVRFSASPGAIERLAPRLGEHSVEVLREAGYEEAEIMEMIREGATLDGGAGD